MVHLSCAEALSMADRFRGKMKDLFIETMIHYLVLDRSYAERPDFEGAKWVLSPPLRETGDQDALWAALAMALWVFHRNFLKMMLGSQLSLPDGVWQRLTIAWIGYCLFMAAINGYVAAYFSTDAWANFKLWGYVFPVAFIIGQGLYVARHLKDEPGAELPPGGST